MAKGASFDQDEHIKVLPAIFLLSLATTSCSYLSLKKQPPTTAVELSAPALWDRAGKGQHATISTGWVNEFKDSQLSRLVAQAIAHNPNLAATAEILKATREITTIGRANRLPTVTSRLNGSRSSSSSITGESYGLNFTSSWEADLWGRLRDLDHATRLDYEAALADYRAARLSLATRTARAYINLISAEQQRQLADTTHESFKKNLRIIERNYRAGIPGSKALDVQFGRNNVTSAARSLNRRTLQTSEAARALENLLGHYPSGKTAVGNKLPSLRREIPTGIPAQMIERRPDLTADRMRLYASALETDAARKNLLPSLSLGASTGTSNTVFRRLLDPSYLASSISANLAQTIYQGKAPTARARAAYFRNQAEVKSYTATALDAFREVESTIETDHALREQERLLKKEVAQTSLAEKQSERDYSEGVENASILSVLEAQRRALNARSALISLYRDRLLNRIDLHSALGGDYDTFVK